jgi:hypothetical protein
MNKKYLLILPALLLTVLFTVDSVSAFGGKGFFRAGEDVATQTKNWEEKIVQNAKIIGISEGDMKDAWAEGKNFRDLAKEKGISEEELRTKMQAQRQEQQKTFLQNLVSQGKITQAQADARIKHMQEMGGKIQEMKGAGRGKKGFGKNCPMQQGETTKN